VNDVSVLSEALAMLGEKGGVEEILKPLAADYRSAVTSWDSIIEKGFEAMHDKPVRCHTTGYAD
jgi:hypothetical protein